jgi:hypothetical protein
MIDGLAGPDQLADVLINWRAWIAKSYGWVGFLPSNESVRRLLTLSFYASLAQEEGRYPRFRVYVPLPGAGNNLQKLASFEPRLPIDDVERLRRLAPAASSLDFALSVVEDAGDLLCDGMVSAAEDESTRLIGLPGLYKGGIPPGLLIRIDRPGELRLSEGSLSLLLRQGRVSSIVPLEYARDALAWLSEPAHHIHDQLFSDMRAESKEYFGGTSGIEGLLFELLAMILAEAVESRTGGAFVILPNPDSRFVTCKYQLKDLALKELTTTFWTACVDATNASDAPQLRNLARTWNSGFRKLLTHAKAVATLSRTDGCVCMDRSFDILGFGGKIQVSNDHIDHAGITYAHAASKELLPEDDIRALGMRHQSAFRLCKAEKNTAAFVVSQDGDLRLFYSDSEHVYFLEGLHAFTTVHPHW